MIIWTEDGWKTFDGLAVVATKPKDEVPQGEPVPY